jgi:uncharacterized protein YjbI with pentapeptide repeats
MARSAEPSQGRGIPKGTVDPHAPRSGQTDDLSSLQGAVNDASSRAAALWLSFLTFMAYLTMTVGAVTHEALLEQSVIQLPVLNVQLPLVGFFWIAPLFFLLFHFYLFLQLVILVRKVASFDTNLRVAIEAEQKREEYRKRLDTFLIVQFLSGAEEERKGLTGRLLRSVAFITLVILPILLLLQFQLTFVPYHDAWVTWVHRLALLVEIRLAWVFWFAISEGGGAIYFPEFQFQWRTFFRRGTHLQVAWNALAGIGRAIRSGYGNSRWAFFGSFGVIFASFFVFAFTDELIARVVQLPVPHISNNEIVWELKPIADIVLHGPINMVEGRPRAWFSNVLVVPNKKLVDDKAVEADFPSLSLRGRNLSGAVLIGSDLRNADFTGANLNDAVLDRAQLARARFGCAAPYDRQTRPGWPGDQCTWLQRASFAQAQLQATDFKRARMHGAILIKANLQGADLSAAQLQGVMLSNAELVGASLVGANLNHAFLDGSILIGVDFSNTQLQDVLLGNTLLHLASIKYVSSPSPDRNPVRIAQPLSTESDKPDDQISRYFLYATVASVNPEMDSENVSANFDLEDGLTKFRDQATASLIPYGIIERDFETTYRQATERKWNDIADIVENLKKHQGNDDVVKDYLVQLACSVGSAAFITPALIRSERIVAIAGQRAIEVIDTLKNPSDRCPGAQSLTPALKVLLGDMEQRVKARGRAAGIKSGSGEASGSKAAELSPESSSTQVAVGR